MPTPLPVLYDAYYAKAQGILDKYNPCRFNDRGECWAMRKTKNNPDPHRENCCATYSCKNLGESGCMTQNISCKLYTCYALSRWGDESQKACVRELDVLKDAWGQDRDFFVTRAQVLKHIKFNVKNGYANPPEELAPKTEA